MMWNYNKGGGVPPLSRRSTPKYDAQGQGPIYGNFQGGGQQLHPDMGPDVVDGKLKPGEHVIKSEAVDAFGGPELFDKINDSVPTQDGYAQGKFPQSYGTPPSARPTQEMAMPTNNMSMPTGGTAPIQKVKKTDRHGNSTEITYDTRMGGSGVPPMNMAPPMPMASGGPVYAYDGWGSGAINAVKNWWENDEEETQPNPQLQAELNQFNNPRSPFMDGQGPTDGRGPVMGQNDRANYTQSPTLNTPTTDPSVVGGMPGHLANPGVPEMGTLNIPDAAAQKPEVQSLVVDSLVSSADPTSDVALLSGSSESQVDAVGVVDSLTAPQASANTPQVTDFESYKNIIGQIESNNVYDIRGGANNHYVGRYQLGADAITDAANRLGMPVPTRDEVQANPELQDKLFKAYTDANRSTLMRLSPQFREMGAQQQMEVLGYAHNQGAGGAIEWMKSGKAGADAFGTLGTKYSDAIRDAGFLDANTGMVRPSNSDLTGLDKRKLWALASSGNPEAGAELERRQAELNAQFDAGQAGLTEVEGSRHEDVGSNEELVRVWDEESESYVLGKPSPTTQGNLEVPPLNDPSELGGLGIPPTQALQGSGAQHGRSDIQHKNYPPEALERMTLQDLSTLQKQGHPQAGAELLRRSGNANANVNQYFDRIDLQREQSANQALDGNQINAWGAQAGDQGFSDNTSPDSWTAAQQQGLQSEIPQPVGVPPLEDPSETGGTGSLEGKPAWEQLKAMRDGYPVGSPERTRLSNMMNELGIKGNVSDSAAMLREAQALTQSNASGDPSEEANVPYLDLGSEDPSETGSTGSLEGKPAWEQLKSMRDRFPVGSPERTRLSNMMNELGINGNVSDSAAMLREAKELTRSTAFGDPSEEGGLGVPELDAEIPTFDDGVLEIYDYSISPSNEEMQAELEALNDKLIGGVEIIGRDQHEARKKWLEENLGIAGDDSVEVGGSELTAQLEEYNVAEAEKDIAAASAALTGAKTKEDRIKADKDLQDAKQRMADAEAAGKTEREEQVRAEEQAAKARAEAQTKAADAKLKDLNDELVEAKSQEHKDAIAAEIARIEQEKADAQEVLGTGVDPGEDPYDSENPQLTDDGDDDGDQSDDDDSVISSTLSPELDIGIAHGEDGKFTFNNQTFDTLEEARDEKAFIDKHDATISADGSYIDGKGNSIDRDTGKIIETAEEIAAGLTSDEKDTVTDQVKGIFGDLFGTDLSSAILKGLVLYAGARLTGMSGGQALAFASKTLLQDGSNKKAAQTKRDDFLLNNVGKFTKASAAKFKKTGNPEDLVLKPTEAGGPKSKGGIKTMYSGSDSRVARSYEDANGVYWSFDGGQTRIDDKWSEKDLVKDENAQIKAEADGNIDVIREIQAADDSYTVGRGDSKETKYITGLKPAAAAKQAAVWAQQNGVDAARIGPLMEQAYYDMIADAKASDTGQKPRDLTPYLNSLIIREQGATPQLFITNIDEVAEGGAAAYVNQAKMTAINKQVLKAAGFSSSVDVITGDDKLTKEEKVVKQRRLDKLNNFYTFAETKWNKLRQEDPERFNKLNKTAKGTNTTGFYLYIKAELSNLNK